MTLLLVTLLIDHKVFSLVPLCNASTINLCGVKSECIDPTKKMSALALKHKQS